MALFYGQLALVVILFNMYNPENKTKVFVLKEVVKTAEYLKG